VSTANTPLYIAQLFDLKSSSGPPFFIELLCILGVSTTHFASARSQASLLAPKRNASNSTLICSFSFMFISLVR
jgi:hypothetical protein